MYLERGPLSGPLFFVCKIVTSPIFGRLTHENKKQKRSHAGRVTETFLSFRPVRVNGVLI